MVAEGGTDQIQAVEGNRKRIVCQQGYVDNAAALHQRVFRPADCHNLFFLIGIDSQGSIAGKAGPYESDFRYMVQDVRNRKITWYFIKIKIDIRVCGPEIVKQMVQKIGGVSCRD